MNGKEMFNNWEKYYLGALGKDYGDKGGLTNKLSYLTWYAGSIFEMVCLILVA